MKDRPKAYTRKEAAEILGCRIETLSRWHSQHIGPPAVVCGKFVRYHADEFDAWLRGDRDQNHRGANRGHRE